ncbi:AAA family ATPase [Pseudomonas congelans]|uniref:AAA family ATPase n=1 Tax=Pseudomonas congelans TaxID=200452 RepID=UPI001EFEE29D|nr:AAA family ATPase [Pseudomonas congelans]
MIDKIWSDNIKGYKTDAVEGEYLKLRRFNLLIGSNNSGKSRLLRALFSTELSKINIGLGREFQQSCRELGGLFDLISKGRTIYGFNCSNFMVLYDGGCRSVGEINSTINSLVKLTTDAANISLSVMGGDLNDYYQVQDIVRSRSPVEAVSDVRRASQEAANLKRHYIPILRGMRPLQDNKDLFLDRTLKDYFASGEKTNLNIITGFDLYKLLAQFLLGQPEERQRVRSYETILGNEFFGGQEITLIPQYGKDTVAVKIGEDNQFSIYDLGDGLQQVIIITSAAYLEQDRSIFFIEEPEACLHPGLLRKLALFLLNHTKHQYLATTHSNHLLDLAESHKEVVIHKVSKAYGNVEFNFKTQECTTDRELLADLGVLASSVYLANSTIWVEGITDRLYLKAFMRKYLQNLEDSIFKIKYESFLENYHYSFVEYQGGALGHWGFDDNDATDRLSASRLCSAAFLIADGDIFGKGDRAGILDDELKERFYLLPAKEIESLLPLDIILKTALRLFSRKKVKTTIDLESDNLKKILSRDVVSSQYGIGYHLDRCLGLKGKGSNVRRVFADDSGTVSDKVKFCREALLVMSEEDWAMPAALEELCVKIYSHVSKFNH